MTVSSQTNNETFHGNSLTTIWDLPFRFFDNADIDVYLIDPVTGAATPMVLGTDYTLSGAGLPEQFGTAPGKITTTLPVVTGKDLYVERVMEAEQHTDIVNQGRFFPEVHEDVFDRLTMLIQQNKNAINNSLQTNIARTAWDFKGRPGINVADPTNLQDAATRNYVEQYIGSIIATGTGPSNFAANVLYTDVVGVVRNLQQLSSVSNTAWGAGMIGRATRQIETMAELLLTPGRYNNDMVFMERRDAAYDGGSGHMIWASASTTTANNVTVFQVTGTPVGRWLRVYDDLEAAMFGARPVAGFDNATAFAAIETFLRAELAAFRKLPIVWLNSGTYEESVASNWGIQGATILNRGKVKIRCTGLGSAMKLDAGVGIGVNLTNLQIGIGNGFILECGPNATATTCYIRNVYLSEIRCRVWGGGLAQAGFSIYGCVLTCFYIGTTPTESAKEPAGQYTNGWYNGGTGTGGKPQFGKIVDESVATAQTAYCTFYNWIGAACQYGMYIVSTLGNLWLGGDNEYNTLVGAVFTGTALLNRERGMNHEVNTNGDVECAGNFNTFDCDSVLFKFIAGSGNRLIGGTHDQVSALGGIGHYIGEIVYGRGLSGNLVINDAATRTRFGECYQAQTQTWSRGPVLRNNVVIGASPFTYTNTRGRTIRLFLSLGTVSNTSYYRGGTIVSAIGTTNLSVSVSPGDSIVITHTGAPTATELEE